MSIRCLLFGHKPLRLHAMNNAPLIEIYGRHREPLAPGRPDDGGERSQQAAYLMLPARTLVRIECCERCGMVYWEQPCSVRPWASWSCASALSAADGEAMEANDER